MFALEQELKENAGWWVIVGGEHHHYMKHTKLPISAGRFLLL